MTRLRRKIHIQSEKLEISYDNVVALSIDKLYTSGNIIALVGPNGSGKSTFMKGLLQLLTPSQGELYASIDEKEERRKLIPEQDFAYSPEENAIFSDFYVEEYLQLWCRLKCTDPMYYKNEGALLLNAFELHPLMKKRGRELSKGQRRRLQAALGFMIRPKLFLLDEPFDGLDSIQSDLLIENIYQYIHQTGLIISTHRLDIVHQIADTVIKLQDGRIDDVDMKRPMISHSDLGFLLQE